MRHYILIAGYKEDIKFIVLEHVEGATITVKGDNKLAIVLTASKSIMLNIFNVSTFEIVNDIKGTY